jgi:hypothetical protein
MISRVCPNSVVVTGVSKSSDGKEIVYHATDDRASFTLTDRAMTPCAGETQWRSPSEWVPMSKVDYMIGRPQGGASRSASYLQVRTVAEGEQWYQQNSKYPVEVCEMLAKYEWGDLKHTTPKEFRNLKKRTLKKSA